MKDTTCQERVTLVLDRLQDIACERKENAEVLANAIENFLNILHFDDFFGTEGQCDPRGDFRNGSWSMEKVEGID